MAKQYFSATIVKNTDGKNIYQSTIYPKIAEADDDIYISVTELERLDLIANRIYKNPTLWKMIAVANGLPKDSLYVKENTQLRLPNPNRVSQIISDLESLNNSSY